MDKRINIIVDGNYTSSSTYKSIILKPNIVDGKNLLTLEMFSSPNTKYIIKWNYIAEENITIPEECIIEFDGGNISGGTLIGQNTKLLNPYRIELGFNYAGTWEYMEYSHKVLTEDEYDSLVDKRPDTIYLIVEE